MKSNTICGLNAVAALFANRPDDVLRLFYTEAMTQQVGAWCATLAAARKPYRKLELAEMEAAAGTAHHGQVAAVAKPRPVPILDFANPPRARLLLVLDGIGNPHNLGAIARSAAFFGVRHLLIGEGIGHALPSDAAYRTAEGGMEALAVFRTRNLPAAMAAIEPYYRTVAASLSKDAGALDELPRDRAIALVLGAEEAGVSEPVRAACRREVRILPRGPVQSLNVAQAAAVLLHALTAKAA